MNDQPIVLDISLNENVLYKLGNLYVSDNDTIALQEIVDTLYASVLLLMVTLEVREAGQLTGKVLTSALLNAEKIEGIMEIMGDGI